MESPDKSRKPMTFPETLPSPQESMRVFLIGLLMGTADGVPGVSGGTIALLTGIYGRLLTAIAAVTPGRVGTGVRVYPGGGFRWTFAATSDGLERRNYHKPSYYVCSALEPGEYRFAFFRLGDSTISTTFIVKDA